MNALELCIGIVLLIFCWNYLQGHQAEKASLITGFEVIKQKVNVFMVSPNGDEANLLREKYDLQRSFDELLSLSSNGQCLSVTEVEEVRRLADGLEEMSIADFEDKYYALIQFASKTYTKAKQACDPSADDEEEEQPEEEKELTEDEFKALLDESLEDAKVDDEEAEDTAEE